MNSDAYDPIQYKISSIANWNSIAPNYHKNWAKKQIGPFKSTKVLVKSANIRSNDTVLDLACGTGVVSKEVSRHLGKAGMLVGIDLSRVALSIAKSSISFPNSYFVEMDAENIGFCINFDKVVCQYALMFFPDTGKVLKSVKGIMKKDGKIAVAVHGTQEGVPYFSTIMNPVLLHIPDIRPKGIPTSYRFGDPNDLFKEISNAGFSNIDVRKHTFQYNAGTFEEYWTEYMTTTVNSIRSKIEAKGIGVMSTIKKEAKITASRFTKNDGSIEFPWDVLIASAYN